MRHPRRFTLLFGRNGYLFARKLCKSFIFIYNWLFGKEIASTKAAKRLPNPSARRATKSFSHPAERRAITSQFPAFYAPASKRSTASSDARSTKAVLAAARALEREGYSLNILPCDENGVYSPDTLKRMIRPETALVSLQVANS